MEEVAGQVYDIPGSTRQQVSVRTLERYLSLYRKGGYEALKPQVKSSKGSTRIPAAVLQKAVELRKERPERSVEQIIFLLEEHGIVSKGSVAYSTLSRQLRQAGATRQILQENRTGYRRFEAEDVHVLWQADFQHTLYLPDPKNPKKSKKALLFAILDDYSRYIVQAQFYWDEKLPRLEDSLKKAILRHGVCEQFYCDNGAAFASIHLARICGKLGIQLSHSRPKRPAGRGKVERFFQFVDTSFKPEAYQQVEAGHIQTLEELNRAFSAWLDGYYHIRKHGSTNVSPKARLEGSQRKTIRVSAEKLTDTFLWEEERTVDKAGCISIEGNQYEVDSDLVKRRILLGVLTGEVDSGKSTLIRCLFQSLDSKRHFPIYMSMTGLKPRDFYGELLRHVGEEIPFSLTKAKRLWSETLESRQEQVDKSLIVVVDEAQEMSPSMLTELRFVVGHQMDSCSLFPFILVGQPELRKTLRLKKHEAVAQRIPMQYHLSGLTSEETASYIRHQMQAANLTKPVFAESAISQVHAASQGIPRVINLICNQALFDGQQRSRDVIEESHVIRVLADLDRQRGVIV